MYPINKKNDAGLHHVCPHPLASRLLSHRRTRIFHAYASEPCYLGHPSLLCVSRCEENLWALKLSISRSSFVGLLRRSSSGIVAGSRPVGFCCFPHSASISQHKKHYCMRSMHVSPSKLCHMHAQSLSHKLSLFSPSHMLHKLSFTYENKRLSLILSHSS